MTVTTVTLQQVLIDLAHYLRETRSEWVTAVAGANKDQLTLGNSSADDNAYVNALAQVYGKTPLYRVSAFASKVATVVTSVDTTIAANDRLTLAWWRANDRDAALDAIHTTIRNSYPGWWRDVRMDKNGATDSLGATFTLPTLAESTFVVTLPGDLKELLAIGFQDVATAEPQWKRPYYHAVVEGEVGAQRLRFIPYPRGGTYNSVHAGSTLCLRYAAAEPVPTTEAGTTEMPLEYLVPVAAMYYRLGILNTPSDTDLRQLNSSLPQFFNAANRAASGLRVYKPRPVFED